MRAVAVLLVVIYHAELGLPGGFVGVDVFFVISGFVITKMLLAELANTDRIGMRRFYLRRIRRLLPALGLMLTVVLLASGLLSSIGGQQITARTGAAAALFSANTFLIRFGGSGYFDVDSSVNALLHTWSLSVEEQFYFVFPATLFAAWKVGRRIAWLTARAAAAAVLASITALSFLLSWTLTGGRLDFLGIDAVDDLSAPFAFYSSLTRAWEFAVGGLLFLASRRLSNLTPITEWLLVVVGVALVGYASVRFDDQTPFPGLSALVPVVGTLCILAAGEGRPANLVSKSLALNPVQRLGDLSYSWYLWHWPFIVFAVALWPGARSALALGAVASIVPAWLSYRLVEGPIRFAPGSARRTLALAFACIMVPIGAAIVLTTANWVVSETEAVADLEYALRPHADVVNGCVNEGPLGGRDLPKCTWRVDDPARVAVLIGDSNAGHFTEAFTGAANASGVNATVLTQASCPFVDLVSYRDGERDDDCRSFVTESVAELVRTRPEMVVIASSSSWYVESTEWLVEDPITGETGATPEVKGRLWAQGLARVIEPLTDAGVDVVVVNVIPKIPDFDPRECAVLRLLVEIGPCAPSVDRVTAEEDRSRAVQAEVAGAGAAGAATLDVADELCPNGVCATRRDGVWIWRDSHISVDTSIRLTIAFSALF